MSTIRTRTMMHSSMMNSNMKKESKNGYLLGVGDPQDGAYIPSGLVVPGRREPIAHVEHLSRLGIC